MLPTTIPSPCSRIPARSCSHSFASTSAPTQRAAAAALHSRPATGVRHHHHSQQQRRPQRAQRGAATMTTRAGVERVGGLGATGNEYVVVDGGDWVVAPKRGVKGIVHFLGGAFAGASPQLAYPLLCQLLSTAGYTVVATPYRVTFQHDACARDVHQRFTSVVERLREGSDLAWAVPESAPVVGVGHSNGALLHLMAGSLCGPPNAANVAISFNNRQVKEAVPVPLDPIRPAVNAARSDPAFASAAAAAEQLLRGAAEPLLTSGLLGRWQLDAARPAVEQLGTVFGEVGDGADDFTPPPQEVRRIIGASYAVPATLLVQFEDDSIDQTPEMTALLCGVAGLREVSNILLPGSHITPCGGDLPVSPGRVFGPADALAMAVRGVSQADIRRLASRVTLWLDRQLGY